jgi:hypothetical protein
MRVALYDFLFGKSKNPYQIEGIYSWEIAIKAQIASKAAFLKPSKLKVPPSKFILFFTPSQKHFLSS